MKSLVITLLAALAFVLSPVGQVSAVTPEQPHDFACAECHSPHKTLGNTGFDNICLNCHRGGNARAGAKSFAPGDAADPFDRYTSGVSNRFQISHRWDGSDTNVRAGAAPPVQPQMTSVRSRTSGSLACVRCHNPHSQGNRPFLRMANDADQMCMDCHSSRNTTDQAKGTHPVGMDYQQKASANPTAFNASPVNANPSNPTSALKLPGGKVSCSSCHGVHATDSSSSTFDSFSSLPDLNPSDGSLLRTDRRAATADGINICTNCHAGKVAHNGRGQNVQCSDCHGAHVDLGDGSVPNVWLVKRDMGPGRGKVFFNSTSVKNYMSADNSGVCQSCHAVPTESGYQFHLTQTNATCNGCHVHGNSGSSFSADVKTACTACHGYPPVSDVAGAGGYAAGYQNAPSFTNESLSGHASHASSPYQKACESCHKGNSHQSGTFQDVFIVTAGTIAATGGLTPAYNAAAQTCSTVYCHSNANPRGGTLVTGTTPSWNGGKGAIIGTAGECGTCHSAAGAVSPTWSASHTKHINGYAANVSFTCNVCHARTASGNSAIFGTMTARSLHTNGVKDVVFNSFANGGSWDQASAACSNLYCHSTVQGTAGVGAPATFTPVWNGAAMNCGSCHAAMVTLSNISTATGSHKRHVQGYAFDCSFCHGSGYSAAGNTVPALTHVDGAITMGFTGTAANNGTTPSYYQGNNTPGGGYASCSTVYCHSNVQGIGGVGAPTKYFSPVWGSGPVTCGSCHVNMASSGAGAGSHVQHVIKAGNSCPACHSGAGKDPNPPFAATSKHADGTIEISFSGNAAGAVYSKGGSVTPGTGYGSCSSASCHADPYSTSTLPTPLWGTAAGCSACHNGGGAFGAYSAPATGSHTKHMAGSATCGACHAGATAGANGGTGHINGTIDVTNGYPVNVTKHTAGTYTGTCSTASCHADPYGPTTVISAVWGTAAGCAACHNGTGAFTGTGTAPATGSHAKHMAALTTCGDCHAGAVAGTNGGGANHANGTVEVSNSYTASPVVKHAANSTYTGTCTTSCHSPFTADVTTPAWGLTSTCSSCHDSQPLTGSHSLHSGLIAGCSDCHAGAIDGTSGGTGHFDGNIDVINGYPANVAKHTAGNYTGTCSSAACHADPYGSSSATTPVWGVTSGCAACHNSSSGAAAAFDATYGAPATGAHSVHLGASVSCPTCHANVSKNTNQSVLHKNGSIDVTGYAVPVAKHAIGANYTNTCTVTCHGTSPTWGAVTSNNLCTKCHGTGTAVVTSANRYVVAPADAAAADTGKVSSNTKTGAHQTHLLYLNGFSNYSTVDYRCEACHGTLPASGTHANSSSTPQGSFQKLANKWGSLTPTYSSGTCATTYCHNPSAYGQLLAEPGTNPSPSWTDAAYIADGGKNLANCSKCHLVPGAPLFSKQAAHGVMITDATANQCSGCHGHNGDATGLPGQRHLDGIKSVPNNSCKGCHGYEAGSWAAAPSINAEGKGAHDVHVTYLTTKRFTVTLSPASDSYASAAATWTNVCGICHGNTFANHQNGTVNVSIDPAYLFGTSGSPTYSGTPGVLQANNKACSNVSCHYFTTPIWSAY